MRFLIFAILAIFLIWALKSFAQASSKKIANKVRSLIVILPIIIAAIFVFLGKILFSLPFLILILPLLKIKGGLTFWQLLYLWRTLRALKVSGRFRFGETETAQPSSMQVSEAYKILNLDPKKKYNAKEINISVPLVVRLAGTNFKEGKEILDNSGLKLISAENLDDAAKKIVKAIK